MKRVLPIILLCLVLTTILALAVPAEQGQDSDRRLPMLAMLTKTGPGLGQDNPGNQEKCLAFARKGYRPGFGQSATAVTALASADIDTGQPATALVPPTSTNVEEPTTPTKFPPDKLKSDLNFLLRTLEDVHPDLYRYRSRPEIYEMKQRIEKSLTEPLTRLDFYRRVAPLVSAFGDGHTSITYPVEELNEYLGRGGRLFPLETRIVGDSNRLFVAFDYNGEIPPGSEIVGLNGLSTSKLISELANYVSGEKLSYRLGLVNTNLRALLWFIYGAEDFKLKYVSPSGETLEKQINGLTRDELTRRAIEIQKTRADKQRPQQEEPKPEAPSRSKIQFPYYNYISRPDLKTAIIDFRSFQDPKTFEAFLQQAFTDLKERGIGKLIIDIRQNGGGNSALGDALLGYLTDKPWRQFSKVELKVSKQIKDYYRDPLPVLKRLYPQSYEAVYQSSKDWYRSTYVEISSTPDGQLFTSYPEERRPAENPLRFQGQVYVLIGQRTFSSAVNLAATIKDYKLGTLVGEETGGLATQFGDIYSFWLPNTGLQLGVSHKKFYRPSGRDNGRGVLPDIEVKTTTEDLLKGKDPVMDYISPKGT